MPTQPKDGMRVPVRTVVLFALSLVAILVLALLTGHGPKPQANPRGTTAPGLQSPWAYFDITVTPQSIVPQVVTAPAGVPVEFTITNQGEPCLFQMGPYVGSVTLPQGQTVDLTVVTSLPAASANGSASDLPMGCLAQDQREGRLALVPPVPGASATATGAGSRPPAAGARDLAITVKGDGVAPPDVNLRAGVPLRLVLTNEGDSCLFSFGNYLRDVSLAPHGSAEVVFTPTAPAAPVTAAAASAPASQSPALATMGCSGDASRQGTIGSS